MTKVLGFFFFNLALVCQAQVVVLDSISKEPVSFATISFGNGMGIFADDEGKFVFNKKLYPDVDSLYISAIGYKNLKVSTEPIPAVIPLNQDTNLLDEVIIETKVSTVKGKPYKTERLKPYLDDDYYNCWLPTIESEIAVYFPNEDKRTKKITSVKFPIALESQEWNKRKRSNREKKRFSTLFKVQFYSNNYGKPGKVLSYKTIVFRATERDGDFHDLNVFGYDIFVPENGFFVSLQVMGYTDASGKLLPNKKYKEIKSKNGIVKIPTNFRPLLPFTDKMDVPRTYIKRVFINGNDWQRFTPGSNIKSSLLQKGLFNYGIGVDYGIFKSKLN